MKKTIAITGASGFFGRHIVGALRARDISVKAVIRNYCKWKSVCNFLGPLGEAVESAKATLEDTAALERAFAGTDAVVHNAALADPRRNNWQENLRANVIGTENVINAMRAAGVRRLVFISSIGVYHLTAAHLLGRKMVREQDAIYSDKGNHRQRNAYRVTKAIAEHRCIYAAESGAIDLTILRTSAIYGTFDPNILPTLKRLLDLPFLPVPMVIFPLVFAGDAASAVAESLLRPTAENQIYNLSGPNDVSLYNFVRTWRSIFGGRARLLPVPLPIRIHFDNTRAMRDLSFRHRPLGQALQAIATESI